MSKYVKYDYETKDYVVIQKGTGHILSHHKTEQDAKELADVVIAAYCWAELAGLSLDAYIAQKWTIIFERGYGNQAKDPENNP